ncbi:hypothetical protein ACFFK0_04065 [Paenibacillus chartarius]|uniref:DUF4386 family protein n=1 Tax=Paenibacillus chartarius TaxID=747481 RepID=A0ABV6DG57_9BACL
MISRREPDIVMKVTRFGAAALAVAGVLFVLYPALRPFSDEATMQGAAAFASTGWIVSHVFAILGFILMMLGVFGLYILLQGSSVERLAYRGMLISWIGTGLTLPFYGAEVFSLNAIGREAMNQQNVQLISLANAVRFGPGFVMITAGLILLGLGTALMAAAIWKSRLITKWSGIPFALGFLLYLPQYMGSQPIRVAHGLLITVGCLWMAVTMWRRQRAGPPRPVSHQRLQPK